MGFLDECGCGGALSFNKEEVLKKTEHESFIPFRLIILINLTRTHWLIGVLALTVLTFVIVSNK